MLYETITMKEINPSVPDSGQNVTLRTYCRKPKDRLADDGERWAVLILPGGGYQVHGPAEGEPVAIAFMNAGVQAFVLKYSVAPARWPQAFLEACASIAYIRRNADKYGIRPDHIAVCGFSAGGHLAGCTANLWCLDDYLETIDLESIDARPDAAILSYPVISVAASIGGSTFPNLLGPDWAKSTDVFLSLDTSVTRINPPAFLWAAFSDGSVPVENTLKYADAMKKAGVPFEMHIFQDGPHAMALATRECAGDEEHCNAHVANWFPLCLEWLQELNQKM